VPRLTGSRRRRGATRTRRFAVGDLTVDGVTLTARSLAFIVKVSRELVEDASPPT
jgi:hypothetical protein